MAAKSFKRGTKHSRQAKRNAFSTPEAGLILLFKAGEAWITSIFQQLVPQDRGCADVGVSGNPLGSDQSLLHQKFQIPLWSGKDYSYCPNDPCRCEAQHIFSVTVFLFLFRSETDNERHSRPWFSPPPLYSTTFSYICIPLSLHSTIFSLPLGSLSSPSPSPHFHTPSLFFPQWLTLLPSNCLST